jgi:Amt family ammonium transporter
MGNFERSHAMRKFSHKGCALLALGIGLVAPAATAFGQDGDPEPWQTVSKEMFTVNNLWIMIAAFLVFIMHLGFAMVESGMTRAKNTVNILFKNIMIICIGLTTYAICGWMIMYPGEFNVIPGVFSFAFGIGGGAKGAIAMNSDLYNAGYTVWTDFLFQAMFAATAATIVSGAVAGRIKLLPFLIFSTVFVAISYPITGSWHWGGGWLGMSGTGLPAFEDFAGSTVVHAVGGAGALVGALMLGPRLGKYAKDGTPMAIPGHNIPLATIGVFLLWFGWFGFNGGSELSANPSGASWVVTTTALAAAGGGLAAAITCWIHSGKPDPTMGLNGILGGLVGITACCHLMNWIEAMFLVGAVSGILVYASVLIIDKLGIDDPVGAISVHGVVGIYGTLCAGLWGAKGLYSGSDVAGSQLLTQAIGTGAVVVFTLISAAIIFSIVKALFGLRVDEHEEIEGLDLGEHDMAAYPDFQRTYIKSYHAGEI